MTFFGYQFEHTWLLLFAPIIAAVYLVLARIIRKRSEIPYPPLQHKAASMVAKIIPVSAKFFDVLLILLIVVALAKPFKSTQSTFIEENGIDILLNVDLSSSMMATDFQPNRLEATKKIIADFVRRSGGHRIGMVIFAKHVFTLSPFINDHLVLKELIEGLSLNSIDHNLSGGTAIGDAILRGTEICSEMKIEGRDQIMILLTDGDNNSGVENRIATRYAKENKIKIYTIGLGSTDMITVVPDPVNQPDWSFESQLVEEPLKEIAAATGGRYFHAKGNEILGSIFAEIAKLEQTPLKTEEIKQRNYKRYPLIWAVSILFMASFLLRLLLIRRPLK